MINHRRTSSTGPAGWPDSAAMTPLGVAHFPMAAGGSMTGCNRHRLIADYPASNNNH